MNELIKKLDQILRAKFPDESSEDIQEIVQNYGKIAIVETLEKTLELLKNDTDRKELSDLIESGRVEEAFDFAESKGIEMGQIFEEISKKIVVDIFSD
jgi:uncharacterized protein YdbL (DUF1318 family)